MTAVELDGQGLSPQALLQVARDGAPLRFSVQARQRIAAAHALLLARAEAGEAI
ncbi:hypothetical protein HX857_19265 [Pseudomonas gingeri]|nr:hypothetical protein [Pseudomonas gingeri]NWE70840.1 hypothetical protein [Pseudomonas gingeri]